MSYPVELNIKGKNCLVAGAGNVAAGKIQKLLKSGARIRVVGPLATGKIIGLAKKGRIKYSKRVFKPSDLKGVFLVIAATDDSKINSKICALASKKNILANNAGSRLFAGFSNMAEIRVKGMIIAVSSSGKNVKKAVWLRNKLYEFIKGEKNGKSFNNRN